MAVTSPPPFERSQHLVALVAEIERLAAAVAELGEDDAAADAVRESALLATLQLDGSTITSPPDDQAVADLRGATIEAADASPTSGTWLDALDTYLDLDRAEDATIWTLEYLGASEAMNSDDLADELATNFVSAIGELHRRLTRGLIAPEAAAVPRASDLAVQDRSVGRIVFFPASPDVIEHDVHLLGSWVEGPGAREHGLVLSGVVHYELLRIHPFLSANGRLARTAARLLLRSRGLDPHQLAVAETALNEDPLVAYEQVAKSIRRRDLTIWLETWGEAVAAGLRTSLRRLQPTAPPVDPDADEFVFSRAGTSFTVAEYRAALGAGPEDSRAQLDRLLDAGRVTRVLGGRGLRFHAAVHAHTEPFV